MTNEELAELCTRVATKVLGWEQEGIYWLWPNGDRVRTEMAACVWNKMPIDLISPWGRDLVERAMEKMPRRWVYSFTCNEDREYRYIFQSTADATIQHKYYDSRSENKNIACLLAADKAVSDG